MKAWLTVLGLIALGILAITIMMAAARIQLLVLASTAMLFIWWYFSRKRQWARLAVFSGVFLAMFAIAALAIPGSKQRLTDTYHEWLGHTGKSEIYQTNHRYFIWRDGLKVIRENLWTGTGTGAANDALHEKLKLEEAKFWIDYTPYTLGEKAYNFHNSFLQHFATLGLVGFLLLVSLFIVPFFRKMPFLHYLFLWIFFVSILTESMLVRQAGTLFFGCFFALLICLKPEES